VALARAVYARADIIILDDVLAALDSHVARHVMDQVIGHQGILASKARLVVTHSVAHVNEYDSVLYLRRGIILDSGPTAEVLAQENSQLSRLVRGHSTNSGLSGHSTPRSGEDIRSSDDDEATTVVNSSKAGSESERSVIIPSRLLPAERRSSFGKAKLLDSLPVKAPAELSKEHREKGIFLFEFLQDVTDVGDRYRTSEVARIYDLC
jgi:ATP-binding cassette subfamily C (CFTR/MRP) protein 1